MRATVRDVLGPDASELFFERLLTVFFTDEDAALLAADRAQLRAGAGQLPALRGRQRARCGSSRTASGTWTGSSTVRPARHLHGDRPARRAGRPEPSLALRQPDPRTAAVGAPRLPGPGGQPLGAPGRPLPGPPRRGRLQPARRAGRRVAGRGRAVLPAAGHRGPRGRPRPHPVPGRQHLLHRVRRLRRAVGQHRLRLPRLRRRGPGRGRPLPGAHRRHLVRRRGPGAQVPAALGVLPAHRHAGLGRRVRSHLHRRPRARRGARPDPGRPAGHLPPPRRELVDLDLQGPRARRAWLRSRPESPYGARFGEFATKKPGSPPTAGAATGSAWPRSPARSRT